VSEWYFPPSGFMPLDPLLTYEKSSEYFRTMIAFSQTYKPMFLIPPRKKNTHRIAAGNPFQNPYNFNLENEARTRLAHKSK